MSAEKSKHTVWLPDSAWAEVEDHYKADNCATKNEFIEKAIRFYCGYLDTESAGSYLPRVLSDVLEGKLGTFGNRIGRLLFKLAVEQDMTANLLGSDRDVSEDRMERLRVRCVKNVKRTNGEVTFEDAVRYQKGDD